MYCCLIENVWEICPIKLDFDQPNAEIGRKMASGRLLFLALVLNIKLNVSDQLVNSREKVATQWNIDGHLHLTATVLYCSVVCKCCVHQCQWHSQP